MNRLADKTAVVTGGSSGIGLAVARAFLDEGARVAITGRQQAKLRQAAESLPGRDRLFLQATDVGQIEQVQALVHQVEERLGPVAILVNNAGINIRQRALRELSVESWR